MRPKYSNISYLKTFDVIYKYNVAKKQDILHVDKICFEISLRKDSSDTRFTHKIYIVFYLLFNTFSFINYKIIPGTQRNVFFQVKLDGLITNRSQIEAFIQNFVLEKKKLLEFKSVTQRIIRQDKHIYLSLCLPLAEYIQLNSVKIHNFSFLNIEQEVLLLKFRLSKKNIMNFFFDKPVENSSHYFSFWKLLVKKN